MQHTRFTATQGPLPGNGAVLRTAALRGAVAAVGIIAFLGTAPVHAQTQRSGGGEAQKMMQQYQQLAAERTSLQAQVAQLQKDLDAAKADAAAAKKQRDALKSATGGSAAAVAQANSGKAAAEQSLEQSKQRMTELVAHFRETAGALKQAELDRDSTRKTLAERNQAFDKCADSNFQLYQINSEILDRYEHVGLFTKVGTADPITRISRTRIENLVDDYRARALELRVKKPPPTPPAPAQ